MIYRQAGLDDINQVEELQRKYHVDTIKEEDKKDGFVTTLFTRDQLERLVTQEDGLSIAMDEDRLVAYAMAASWDYWEEWPLFAYMIGDLKNTSYLGEDLSTENSYQYGPVCIDRDYRGGDVLLNLFEYSRRQMKDSYPYLITFINHTNPRSYAAHRRKVGMDLIKNFKFNNNNYYELGYDTSKKTNGSNI